MKLADLVSGQGFHARRGRGLGKGVLPVLQERLEFPDDFGVVGGLVALPFIWPEIKVLIRL